MDEDLSQGAHGNLSEEGSSSKKTEIVHRLGVIRVEGSLDEWYEQYNEAAGQPDNGYELSDELMKRQRDLVRDDTLDVEMIDQDIEKMRLIVQLSHEGKCLKCQLLADKLPEYFSNAVRWLPLEDKIWHYTDFCEWEASHRAGCKLCTLFMQSASNYENCGLIEYRKIEQRLFYLRKKVRATFSLDIRLGNSRHLPLMFTGPQGYGVCVTAPLWIDDHSDRFFSECGVPLTLLALTTHQFAPLELAKQWLSSCEEAHTKCGNKISDRRPTRLLFLDGTAVKLVHSAKLRCHPRYATLSHSWGTVDFLKLTKNNMTDFEIGISIDSLTKTFQDAIHVTQRLGIQYLWIDSLCIIQDSFADWEEEASLMSHVYGNSIINLAAASSLDGRAGLHFAPASYCSGVRIEGIAGTGRWFIIRDAGDFGTFVVESHLSSRAWTLQERILAPRTVFFTVSGLYWECRSKMASEACPEGFYGLELAHEYTLRVSSHTEEWFDIVGMYSAANLSFGSDKLVALAGIAREAQRQHNDQYLAGIWRKDLLNQLCWGTGSSGVPSPRPSSYRAPTWSWASIDGSVGVSIPGVSSLTHARVVDVWTTPSSGDDPFGQICGGLLELACTGLLPQPHNARLDKGSSAYKYNFFSIWEDGSNGYFSYDSSDEVTRETYLLPFGETTDGEIMGIVIEQGPCLKGQFRRVGSFSAGRSGIERIRTAMKDPGPAVAAAVCLRESHDPGYPEQKYVIQIV